MAKPNPDPITPWFHIAEELEEFIGIRFGRIAPGTTEPEWSFLRHTDFDGIGGFAELLRRRGAYIPTLPQVKHPAPPSWFAFVRALPKFLKPRQRVKWSAMPRGSSRPSSRDEAPTSVAWHVFDEDITTQIRRVCRRGAITINSFLLKHLTKAIRPSLQDHSAIVPWMIPVNLRGKVKREKDTDNFTSYVGVKVSSYETIDDIHRNIYKALGRGEHWANWYAYKAGKLASRGIKKFLIVHELAMSQWNIGSFSNLGDWDPEKAISQTDCEGAWLFAPPVLRCQVLGVGCVTFQNQLTLTIQTHPELTTSASVPKLWIQNWIREIEIDIASFLAEPTSNHWSPR